MGSRGWIQARKASACCPARARALSEAPPRCPARSAAFFGSARVAYTNISASDLNPAGPGDESSALGVHSFVADADVTIENADVAISTRAVGGSGETAPSIESANPVASVNNALTMGNYVYTFDSEGVVGRRLGNQRELQNPGVRPR